MNKMKCINEKTKVAVCNGELTAIFQHTEVAEVPCIIARSTAKLLENKSPMVKLVGHTPVKLIAHKEA